MFPTDELVYKATTLTSNVQSLIPQIWAPRLEKNLRKRAILENQIIVNTDLLVPGAGDTVYIPMLPDLAAASSLTEGTDMTPIALNTSTSVPLTPKEYGVEVEITRKALDRMKYDGVAEIVDRLGYAMSLTIEGAIAGLWNATVNFGSYSAQGYATALTQVYANGKTSANITSTDTFNDQMILNGIQTLESVNNVPFEDGAFRLIITPSQWASLLQDTNTRQDLRWGDPRDRLLDGPVGMMNGYRGMLHGVRIYVSNHIKTATENTVTVQKALLMAPRWAAIAYKRKPEVVVDPTLYDLGRRRRFGVVADFDVELVHAERAVVLASA